MTHLGSHKSFVRVSDMMKESCEEGSSGNVIAKSLSFSMVSNRSIEIERFFLLFNDMMT